MITMVSSGKKRQQSTATELGDCVSDLAPPPAEGPPVEDESDLGGCTFLHSLLDVGVQFLTSTSPAAQLEGERDPVCSV